jgi:hypothetical protein
VLLLLLLDCWRCNQQVMRQALQAQVSVMIPQQQQQQRGMFQQL